jgi:rare lipoprotein A
MVSRSCFWGMIGVVLASLTGCIEPERPVTVSEPAVMPTAPETIYEEVGRASWYGPYHQGRKTASGERFDMNKLTAAHPTLPLGTEARVTNLETGRSVDVKVNDRGPYVKGRSIDLSAKAAQAIGMKKRGVATVRIEVLPGAAAEQVAEGG